jgi:hypothetical protein
LAAPLALVAVCALARPASASVFVDLTVSNATNSRFGPQVRVSPGQTVLFRLAALDTFSVPVACRCDIPLLNWTISTSLSPSRVGVTTLSAKVTREGTFNVSAFVLFVSPMTGRVTEVADTVVVISGSGDTGQQAGQQQGGQQQAGGQQGDQTGGDIGELSGDTGGKKDTTLGGGGQQQQVDTGGKKDTTLGGGGQQVDTGGKKDTTLGGGGQQQGGQQQGGKKDTGTTGQGGTL